jgi:hypothetical protein
MKTTKRFSPQVLARFERQGRGTGTYAEALPWHQVTRGDPASSGRSHLLNWRGRLRHLLSDGELGQQLFATMLPNLDDCLEQCRLYVDPAPHLLSAYFERDPNSLFPGTLQLARELGMRHPRVFGGGQEAYWTLTTDLVLVFRAPGQPRELLAIAYKPGGFDADPRKVQLLKLEREYWARRGVAWLLITPGQSIPEVVLTIRRIACWALDGEASEKERRTAIAVARQLGGHSQTSVLHAIASIQGSMESAQRSLWQAVWHGEFPLDLRRDWRPHRPLNLVPEGEFRAFNPVASRRSAWTS